MDLFGVHVDKVYASSTSSIVKHLEVASRCFESKVFSIFVSSPRARMITVDPEQIRRFVDSTGIKIIAHSTYAAGITDPFIHEELDVCTKAGISGLVVHLPKALFDTRSISTSGCLLYLETPAVVKGNYHNAVQLNALFEMNPELGICIDTAHLHTSGTPLTTASDMHALLDNLNPAIYGTGKLMFHLNDSARDLGKGPDKHDIFDGKIWGEDKSGLQVLVQFIIQHKIPTILERSSFSLSDIKKDLATISLLGTKYEDI